MTTCNMESKITAENIIEIKEKLKNILNENEELILNFKETEFIDSIGLGMLVSLYKQSVQTNKKLIIKNPNENISNLLKVTSLDELFEIKHD